MEEKARILRNYEHWKSFPLWKQELIRKRQKIFESLSEQKQAELRSRTRGIGHEGLQTEKTGLHKKAEPETVHPKPGELRKESSSRPKRAAAARGKEMRTLPRPGKAENASRDRRVGSERPERPEKIVR